MTGIAEKGVLALVFVFYANLAVIATRFHGVGALQATMLMGLLAVPLGATLALRRMPWIVDRPFIAMCAYLGVMMAASLRATDIDVAFAQMALFLVEGLALYAFVLNAVRTLVMLQQVMRTLLLVACLIGGLTVYQELTHGYERPLGGLAQRNLALGVDESDAGGGALLRTRVAVADVHRAGGPIGEANRYAQVMLVLLPLAVYEYRQQKSRRLRVFAVVAGVCVLCGVFLTYSRGAFIVLALLLPAMVAVGVVRARHTVGFALASLVLIAVVAPGYFGRMDTIRGVSGLFSGRAVVEADGATRGRATEMMAALHVFLDYPLLGVGPGQYAPYYSADYQRDPDIALRFLPNSRRAHIMYFEVAAETGLIGFLTFIGTIGILLYQLDQARRCLRTRRPDLAQLAAALTLSILAYLGTAVFLHLSYQRYFWFLLALAGATLQVIRRETRSVRGRLEDESSHHS